MTGMFGLAQAVVLLVALQRLAELAWAWRNTRRLLARGGLEAGRGHYPLMVLLHGAWLAAIAVMVPADAAASLLLLGAYMALQAGRLWVILSLGPYWTTRIVTVPDAPLVRIGPYRLCRHPNYAVVALEVPMLPLVFGAWKIALIFGVLNLALLAWRIRVEDRVLAGRIDRQPDDDAT
jgi:methyltransferase